MPFADTGSIAAADLNNTLRGLVRDNTDNSHTGDTNETALASSSVTGGTITATGGLLIFAAGTISGTAGTKTIDLQFGATTVGTITQAAGTTSDWYFIALVKNTATNAQRWMVLRNGDDLLTSTFDYTTSAIDTTAAVTLRVTVTLGAAGDTVTQTLWDVLQIQIT